MLKILLHLLQNAYLIFQNILPDIEVGDKRFLIYPHLLLWQYFPAYFIRL